MLLSTSVLCAFLATQQFVLPPVHAAPVQDVSVSVTAPVSTHSTPIIARAAKKKCNDGGAPPCACNNAFGLRKNTLSCPGTTFEFQKPDDPTDGKLNKVNAKASDSQCDHIVELQFIANELKSGTCQEFQANTAQFTQFKNFINGGDNIVYIPAMVNNVKGKYFGAKTPNLSDTNSKALDGLADYLDKLETSQSYPGIEIAKSISDELDKIVGAGKGFSSGFDTRFKTKLQSVITKAKKAIPDQPPYVAPGTPSGTLFHHCNGKRDLGRWSQVRRLFDNLIGRATTKSTSASSSTASAEACPISSATKSASQSATKPAATSKATKATPTPKPTKATTTPKPTKVTPTSKSIKAITTSKPTKVTTPKPTKATPTPKTTKTKPSSGKTTSKSSLKKLTKGKIHL